MCQPSSKSLEERDLLLENALFLEIIYLHPDHHLTFEELVLRMENRSSGIGHVDVLDTFQELKRSGVLRTTDEVIEPTYAAWRTATILGFP